MAEYPEYHLVSQAQEDHWCAYVQNKAGQYRKATFLCLDQAVGWAAYKAGELGVGLSLSVFTTPNPEKN